MTITEPVTDYVVGLWPRVLDVCRRAHPGAQRQLRWDLRYLRDRAREGNWRAVRNGTWKPYRAETVSNTPRCGWGWTPRGARRDLARKIARQETSA